MKAQVLLVVVAACSAFAQGTFQNLDFEAAVIEQTQAPGFVSATNALPGWTVYRGTNQEANVLYSAVGHGGTLVDLLGTNSTLTDGYHSLGGEFSVMLQGGVISGPGGILYAASASILQTGVVPASAKSVLFKAQHDTSGTLSVSLGGVSVPYFALSNGPDYTVFGGDVSSFAGQTMALEFVCRDCQTGIMAIGISTQSSSPPPPFLSQASLPFPLLAPCF